MNSLLLQTRLSKHVRLSVIVSQSSLLVKKGKQLTQPFKIHEQTEDDGRFASENFERVCVCEVCIKGWVFVVNV